MTASSIHRTVRCAVLSAWPLAILLALAVVADRADAQLNGHNFRGDYGLGSGSQPEPGWYLSFFYANYHTGTARDRNGDAIVLDPQRRSSVTGEGLIPLVWWVSDKTVFGGTYSVVLSPSWGNTRLEAPIFGLDEETGFDFGDLYLQPINLGWRTERADYTAGLGVFAPTGSYDAGADDNAGLGMWSYEVFAGATWYLGAARDWNFALTAFWETHSGREGSDEEVGDLLTLEGGFGKSFAGGAYNVGIAYYAQWKLTRDDFGLEPGLPLELDIGKHQVFGLGPELLLPITRKQDLVGFFNARYLFELGAESTTEGDTLFLGFTFPVGSGG